MHVHTSKRSEHSTKQEHSRSQSSRTQAFLVGTEITWYNVSAKILRTDNNTQLNAQVSGPDAKYELAVTESR